MALFDVPKWLPLGCRVQELHFGCFCIQLKSLFSYIFILINQKDLLFKRTTTRPKANKQSKALTKLQTEEQII